ncbi:hypothetical protein DLAC_06990 [Tieghemostelium lacteum]|uniref:NAD-dependent epimerase/dehydratase domain-containing protein n=1 Tax=Tieghemostelium lacteum TaxID=361077 RepID=A0A151ZDW4_TIELA|nr:hypothetical protein DLAC_06990 [Tieghemostelium lacteum]|eukprot:KYQ92148.1 hypothetical protein DLAC_06990 [Tieghemostelium lacteum]
MNILVTGVTGYIGSNLVKPILKDEFKLLNNRKCKVFALVRGQSRDNKILRDLEDQFPRDQFQVISGDFIDLLNVDQTVIINKLRETLKEHKITTIVHLAAKMDFYPTDKEAVLKTNVVGVKNLLKASLSSSDKRPLIERFIYASTTETMGSKESVAPHTPVSELDDDQSVPDYLYGETKRSAEVIVRKFEKKYQLDTIILRFTGVYGRNDDFSIFELIQAVSYGILCVVPSFANGHVMFTHIDDVVQSVILAMVKEKNDRDQTQVLPYTYIIAPNKGMTYSECLVFLNDKLGRQKFYLPFLSLQACCKLFSVVGSLVYQFKEKPFIFKSYTLSQMTRDRVYSNKRAKQELQFQPKYNFKQGLNLTVDDYIITERVPLFKISPVFIFILIFVLVLRFLIKSL